MKPSPKQRQALLHGCTEHDLLVAIGAVRSGKTVAAVGGHCRYMLGHPAMRTMDHGVIGVTEGSIRRNLIYPAFGYLGFLRAMGFQAKLVSGGGPHIQVPLIARTMRIWLFGAADSSVAVSRMAGATLGSFLSDESARQPREVWEMAWSRLSSKHSKAWSTLNPGATKHWFRKDVIQHPEKHANVVHYTMDDNPILDDETKARILAGLRGHARKRLGFGEWADPAGLIYPLWSEGTLDYVPLSWSVGVSWSSAGVFGALVAAHPERSASRGVVVSERRYDPNEEEILSDEEQGAATADWIERVTGGARSSVQIIGSEDTPEAFRSKLRKEGYRWAFADDDELKGLQATSASLAGNAWQIAESCPELTNEISSYLWDEERGKKGEDRPAPGAAPLCTALRAIAFPPAAPRIIEGAVGF